MGRSIKRQPILAARTRSKPDVRVSMWVKACVWANEHPRFVILMAAGVWLLYLHDFTGGW